MVANAIIRLLHKNSERCSLFLYLRTLTRVFLVIGSSIVFSACEPQPQKVIVSGPIMGTTYQVTAILTDRTQALDQGRVNAAALAAMDKVNQSMSTYIPDSELSQINRLPANTPFAVSGELNEVLSEALKISRQSNGYFDATLGKAIRLWGFSEDGTIIEPPSAKALAELRSHVGFQKIHFEQSVLSKRVDDLEINLSAIAKGYAVDKVAEAMDALGINHYLINIGGELRAKGVNEEGKAWQVGVEKPHITGGIVQVVALDNASIATSGDYRNYIEIDGKRFSHTIDPTTLKPIYHRLASVSVVSEKASTADALATAILAMGEVKGRQYAEENGLSAFFIVRELSGNAFEISMTDGFRAYLPK